MILRIDGGINRTYCQNLCLIFFPGAKFPEKEEPGAGTPEVYIKTFESGDAILSEAVIMLDGRSFRGEGRALLSSAPTKERAFKLSVGEAVFRAGTALLGSPPPWGILTGVRPAKVAAELMKGLCGKEELISVLKNAYFLTDPKAKLLAEVNEVEKRAVSLAEKGSCSLYISIPFCPTRCAYCSFVSYSTKKYLSMIPDYLDRLCLDIENTLREIKERGDKLLTVYIGGGTPTILDPKQLDRLLKTVRKSIGETNLLEFTVEAGRPDTVTAEKFDVMLSHGVDRTSINPQILDDGVLKLIGRRHSTADFYRAYEIARKSGIRSINTDLIAGLPGSNLKMFSETVDRIAELSPENVTVHTYCVKRSAEFTEKAAYEGDKLGIYSYSGGDTAECVDYSQKRLQNDGYKPYYLYRQKNSQGNLENVGFAKPNYEGLYNIFIMEELQNIFAVGAGAVTKLVGNENEKIKRIFQPKYSYEYLGRQ